MFVLIRGYSPATADNATVLISPAAWPRVMSTGAMRGHSTDYAPAADLSLRNCGTGRIATQALCACSSR